MSDNKARITVEVDEKLYMIIMEYKSKRLPSEKITNKQLVEKALKHFFNDKNIIDFDSEITELKEKIKELRTKFTIDFNPDTFIQIARNQGKLEIYQKLKMIGENKNV